MSLLRAFSSLGSPESGLDELISLAVSHGYSAIELRTLGGSLDLPAYFKSNFGSPAALARHLGRAPVRVVALDTSLRIIGSGEAERAAFLEFVPWCETVGIPRLRVFDGGRAADDAELAEAAETIRWWQKVRRARGWQTDIMVETHDTLVTAASILRFVSAVPGISILWDAHHTWKKGGEDPRMTWAAIGSHVCHIHVKDSRSVPSDQFAYTYVVPGSGEFPAAPLFAALRKDRFAGPVSLEWEKLWHPYLSSLDIALRAAAENSWW